MASSITWLDSSADEQRRVREMIALFSQRESRDELGIGQIRDVFSDSLFPGTSVIQTRARYFLIVPWVFSLAAQKGRVGQQLQQRANHLERQLVETLRSEGATDGLIGVQAGAAVKILPSAIYWSGLRTFGILTRDVASDQLSTLRARRDDEADELAARIVGDWDPNLPGAPEGFPNAVPGGLDLTRAEALWFRERILATVPLTLLAHLAVTAQAPDANSSAPWRDTACLTAPDDVRLVLCHAELFSLALNGAALLYNVLVAEKYEAAGFDRVTGRVEYFRERYDEWLSGVADARSGLESWNVAELWTLLLQRNPRITPVTRAFVDAWVEAVRQDRVARALDDKELRELVGSREQRIKRGQSRLTNQKLLGAWSGESGSGPMTYRWTQVRRMLTDIHAGIDGDA